MAAKYEVKTTKNGQFMFNLKAANGEIILTSETYTTKAAAMNGIESCRKNSSEDKRFELKDASNGQYYFVLTATNGQTIGKSEMYAASASRSRGIASVKRNAPDARVVELP
jgi:uncharacterized protein YegP (UPF0339 family)